MEGLDVVDVRLYVWIEGREAKGEIEGVHFAHSPELVAVVVVVDAVVVHNIDPEEPVNISFLFAFEWSMGHTLVVVCFTFRVACICLGGFPFVGSGVRPSGFRCVLLGEFPFVDSGVRLLLLFLSGACLPLPRLRGTGDPCCSLSFAP